MVRLSAREIELARVLLRRPEGLTAEAAAESLGVSARTVHRDLRPVSEFLRSRELSLSKRSGRGLKVEGSARLIESALAALAEMEPSNLDPEDRRLSLLGTLFGSTEPIKLRALASGLGAAVGTVSRDLDEIEARLSEFGLSILRKPGYGVEVRGSEREIRQAMSHLILESLEDSSPETPNASHLADRTPRWTRTFLDRDRTLASETLTYRAVEGLPHAIADDSFTSLSVHVALMVERLRIGESVNLDAEDEVRLREEQEYEHARRLAEAIEKEFGLDGVPESEVAYTTMHLRGAKLRDEDPGGRSESLDLETASRVKALMHYVEDQTGVSLVGDSLLYSGLLAHTERAIHRLRDQTTVYNPLLSEVKQDYPALFDLVDQGTKKVFADERVPEGEVGFIAMHFGAALDRAQGDFPRSVLVICSAGIGSSRMLASRLQRAFPQIQSLTNSSLFELEDLENGDFDLIVSTVPLPIPPDSYVQVQPLLSEEEVERVRNHLKDKNREASETSETSEAGEAGDAGDARLAKRAVSESLEVFGGGQTKFHRMAEETQTIADLIDDAFLAEHLARGSVEAAVRLMCDSLASRALISDPQSLERALNARLELGGIGVPGTRLALFHARDESVVRPCFSAHGFEEPLEIAGMDGEQMLVRRALLMAAPLELSPVALEAISEISVVMVERPRERAVLEEGSEARIVAALQSIFARYLQRKLS